MPKTTKQQQSTQKTKPASGSSGIKKKNSQSELVNTIRKKNLEKKLKQEYEMDKIQKEEEKNDFFHKINDDSAAYSLEGQFEMMRGLMKGNKRSGLEIFNEDDDNEPQKTSEDNKNDKDMVDEEHLVKTSEQQMSILEKVLAKKPKVDDLKKKYEKKSAIVEEMQNSSNPILSSIISTKPSSVSNETSTKTQQFELPFIKAPITKTICLYCERERTLKGMMIKYVVIINDKEQVVYHALSEDAKLATQDDEDASTSTGLGESLYPIHTISDHVSKIMQKAKAVVGHTVYHDMIGLFGPRNIHQIKNKLRDIAVIDPNTEQPLDVASVGNVLLIISKLLGVSDVKKMNRIDIAIAILQSYKLHAKIFDKHSRSSSLDLLGFTEQQSIKREEKVQYQQKYMTAINNGIDNILSQMKRK